MTNLDHAGLSKPAVAAVRKWATMKRPAGITDRSKFPWLVCYGKLSGTGKTRLAIWAASMTVDFPGRDEVAAYEEAELARVCIFLNAQAFRVAYLETQKDPTGRAAWQDELARCRLLVLDDVSKIKPTDGQLELLFSVLDVRYGEPLTTILTANHAGGALERLWGEEWGVPLVRRMRERSYSVNFDPQ
jgi:DNA replication protein DnaC